MIQNILRPTHVLLFVADAMWMSTETRKTFFKLEAMSLCESVITFYNMAGACWPFSRADEHFVSCFCHEPISHQIPSHKIEKEWNSLTSIPWKQRVLFAAKVLWVDLEELTTNFNAVASKKLKDFYHFAINLSWKYSQKKNIRWERNNWKYFNFMQNKFRRLSF